MFFTAELCRQIGTEKFDEISVINSFIISSMYESRVKTTSSIQERENRINNYMMMHKISVYHLTNIELAQSFNNQFEPEEPEEKPSVIELNLKILPDLPKLPSPSTTHEEFLGDIVPGDVVNVDDLNHVFSIIRTDNFLVDVYDHTTSPFSYFNYSNCYIFNGDEKIKLKYTHYELHPNYFTEYYYKFDVFDEMVKRRNYGVDKKYLDNQYKCMKVKICSGFERTKLIIPSVYVVNLDKNDINKIRVFDSKNVVLRYKLGTETHYVARTEKGNCLFQVLIYKNLDGSSHNQKIQGSLLFKGKILSANNDQHLEEWAEKFVNDLPTHNNKTLMELIKNQTAMKDVFSKFFHNNHSNTMINIYLDKLN
ncbi:uncharacterized protein LOC141532543 isoform X2 [Cotesia typhae]|uniref:uncharacterized protein LOC141532543 isoform X2 n=1 Tax=Cotesia typhae TaxID=2053667 RepID=UPI003D69E493